MNVIEVFVFLWVFVFILLMKMDIVFFIKFVVKLIFVEFLRCLFMLWIGVNFYLDLGKNCKNGLCGFLEYWFKMILFIIYYKCD